MLLYYETYNTPNINFLDIKVKHKIKNFNQLKIDIDIDHKFSV